MNLDYYKKEDKIIIANVLDKYKKYNKTGISTHTNFLNEEKLNKLTKYLDSNKIEYSIYSPYHFLQKKIIYFGDEENFIIYYKATISDKLKHQDILGSLFGLGIKEEYIGDIFIEDGFFYLTSLKEMAGFIEDNLSIVKNEYIQLERVNEITLIKEHFHRFNIMVSSLRIDSVLSRVVSKSRKDVNKMLNEKLVLLNYEEVKSNSVNIKAGDILSIRKYGKYKIGEVVGHTKKDNIVLEIIKYV